LEPVRELVQLVCRDAERWMRLPRGRERLLDADVKLTASEREPDAATRAERLRLFDLRQPEEVAVEETRLRFAAGRRCNLDVI
jgi:hypothetical protein